MNFRFFNIPVHIHPTFWIFLLFFTDAYRNPSTESLILGGVLIFSLLVHEYGHALTALYFGASPTILLEAFGGRAQYSNYGITPKQEFIITLNGPLLESVLIAVSYSLLKMNIFEPHSYMHYTLYVTMRLNILWCLFNLIPVGSLDGGHLCRYILEKKFGDQGHRIGIFIGLASVVIAAPYFYFQGLFFFGTLLVIFGFQSFQMLQNSTGSSEKNTPFQSYLQGVDALNNDELEKAKVIFKKLLRTRDSKVKGLATEALAQVYFQLKENQQSYNLLLKSDHESLERGKCLLCKLAFHQGNYELIAKYSREIYKIEPSFEVALLNSQSFAWLNQEELAGAWLLTASQFEGNHINDFSTLLERECYTLVKGKTIFKKYLQKILGKEIETTISVS